jgi:hypothetical protein
MTLTRKDAVATALTVLVVLVFLTTHEGWGVWLIGSSHRWATGAIALLGMATCGLGSPGKGAATKLLATLGVLAFLLTVLALATGLLTPSRCSSLTSSSSGRHRRCATAGGRHGKRSQLRSRS